jgi:hypothetical protein
MSNCGFHQFFQDCLLRCCSCHCVSLLSSTIVNWTLIDPDSKRSIRISALECWRPRRDLNPCYRRERALTWWIFKYLQGTSRSVSLCKNLLARTICVSSVYRENLAPARTILAHPIAILSTRPESVLSREAFRSNEQKLFGLGHSC